MAEAGPAADASTSQRSNRTNLATCRSTGNSSSPRRNYDDLDRECLIKQLRERDERISNLERTRLEQDQATALLCTELGAVEIKHKEEIYWLRLEVDSLRKEKDAAEDRMTELYRDIREIGDTNEDHDAPVCVDSGYVLHLHSQLTKSMQIMGVLDNQIGMVKQSYDEVVESLKEEFAGVVRDKCRIEIECSRVEAQVSELESEVVELRVKVDSRDKAIESLEQTVEEARRQSAESKELQEDIESFSSDMEAVQTMHERREEELQFEIDRLRQRVHDKKKLVITLTKKITACQKYIVEVTDELERVLPVERVLHRLKGSYEEMVSDQAQTIYDLQRQLEARDSSPPGSPLVTEDSETKALNRSRDNEIASLLQSLEAASKLPNVDSEASARERRIYYVHCDSTNKAPYSNDVPKHIGNDSATWASQRTPLNTISFSAFGSKTA